MCRVIRSPLALLRFLPVVSLVSLPVVFANSGCVDVSSAKRAAPSARPTPAPAPAPAAAPRAWLVEDFEQPDGKSGGFHCVFDRNGLGTTVSPDPFTLTSGGAPPSPGHSARYFGSLGDNRAPYSWAQLQVWLRPGKAPRDLREFRSIRFWAKG
ncbi:MAG TPA: hypothetical protein VEQ58_08120, partial [Polyangiaceae bacterium]|nr:hypothetical protein [Polyangiaceae bacterium]